jgi:hypothetical protein
MAVALFSVVRAMDCGEKLLPKSRNPVALRFLAAGICFETAEFFFRVRRKRHGMDSPYLIVSEYLGGSRLSSNSAAADDYTIVPSK